MQTIIHTIVHVIAKVKLGVKYCVYYLLNNVLYCTKQAYSHIFTTFVWTETLNDGLCTHFS